MSKSWRIWLTAVLLLSYLLPGTAVPGTLALPVQTTQQQAQLAQQMLDQMSPEERVGQLFLVTFQGDTATLESDIADLILTYRIGGVSLESRNDNITGYGDPANVPQQVGELVNDLQHLALQGFTTAESHQESLLDPDAVPPTRVPTAPQTAVPLFIALNQEGDSAPYSEIWNGLTTLPSNMALGATWRPAFATNAGAISGQELNSLGVNMLIGPSLDVLENPVAGPSDLGIRSFGSDPYWVGQMGNAYISGVHQGSNGRIAVIAKHFPGYGSSDRPLHEEIPTVRKSLEQLTQIELAPFFAVTNNSPDARGITDGLLSTHIRYQGFQGNIRATTNPVSLDPQALNALMALAPFATWRNSGGLLVSDRLGVRAVERFYDDTEQTFPHRVVAKEAFSAGNDVLFLSDFALGSGNRQAELANIKDTILWFQERYNTDVAFQEQVDTAVLRILQLKLRLYQDDFSPENVLGQPPEAGSDSFPNRKAAVFDIAQNAITLISPSPEELAERMARPPSRTDNIVIFTNVRTAQQCSSCSPQPTISRTALADRMIALYGPDGSGQVVPDRLSSYSFADLQAFLDAGPGPIIYNTAPVTPTVQPDSTLEPTPTLADGADTPAPLPTATPPPGYLVQESLANVDWIIFAMLDSQGANAETIHNFLAQRPDLTRDKAVIVFAYNAPYILDATEISQLTAYYGVYSKAEAFIDASVRVLFQEIPAAGNSPVNISSIGYDLFTQTQPDPLQIIELYVVENSAVDKAFQETNTLDASVGDTVRLQTGIILDRNGHPVPDDTVVQFIQRDLVQGLLNIIAEVPTQNGVAQLDYLLESRTEGGQFRIGVKAGDATVSQEVDIVVGSTESGEAQITIINPTPMPTSSPTPEPTETVTSTPPPTNTTEPTGTPLGAVNEPEEPGIRIELSELWLLTAVFAGLIIVGNIALSMSKRQHSELDTQIGWLLWSIIGGLICYIYYMLGLPGTAVFSNLGAFAGLATTLLGGFIAMVLITLRQRFT